MQLTKVEPGGPGLTRRRRGKGFSYHDLETGEQVTDPAVLDRVQALVIPPAWRDVWICPVPEGHIQAVGTDAAGRRQYRYHEEWTRQRDSEKFERVAKLGAVMPEVRLELERRLAGDGLPYPLLKYWSVFSFSDLYFSSDFPFWLVITR